MPVFVEYKLIFDRILLTKS